MVSIHCLVYNHEPFLRQCLEGFVMQKASFRFEAIVHDDASTDGSTSIIRDYAKKYPDIIKPIFETENQYSKKDGSLGKIMAQACVGKYVALCEGDDYWNDPLKLQVQVDYMECHPECGLCYSNFNILKQDTGVIIPNVLSLDLPGFPPTFSSPEDFILNKGYYCPPSWLMRNSVLKSLPTDWQFSDGSFVMFAHFLCTSKVHYIDSALATYRVLSESASHSAVYENNYKRDQDLLRTQLFLLEKYSLNLEYKEKCIQRYYNDTDRLIGFVLHNKIDDIKQLRKVKTHYSIKERGLLLLYACHVPSQIISKFYTMLCD